MDKELQKLIILNPKISTKTEIIGSIYALINKINGKIYIGKTIQAYTTRWREHYCNAVTKNLPNCTSSNTASSVNKNANYSTLISANNGYKIDSITVTMSNTDITSSVVTDE